MARRSPERWASHPFLAWSVRVGVLLVPALASVLVALLVMAVVPAPRTLWPLVAWWVLVLAAALAASFAVDRFARRALPLAVLLQLSLVFPDRAPSRLRTARRTGLREMERQVEVLQREENPAVAAESLVALVGALGLHDRRTRGHSERVRVYVDMLTEQLDLPEQDRARLRWASLLHDIGKLTVPGSVLNGGSDMADEEWESLRRHPVEGERLAAGLMPWLGEWGRCVKEHHERWDGTGYPLGLAGNQISLGARIVSVADAYEVMTANRSYSKAVSPEAARRELAACAGSHFDPAVVRAFLEISIGRLRGVLGPMAFLSVVPLGAVADHAGRAARTTTGMVAAAGVTALSVPATVHSPHTSPAVAPSPPVTSSAPAPLSPADAARPTPALVALPRARPAVASPATRTAEPRAVPQLAPSPADASPQAVPPTSFGRLYLGEGLALRHAQPTSSTALSVTLRPGGQPAVFARPVQVASVVEGRPTVVLYQRLIPRHGQGTPKGRLSLTLLDCPSGGGPCRTLSTGTMYVGRQPRDWQQRTVRLSPASGLVPVGHELRLSVALAAHPNIAGVVLGYDGLDAPSRVDVP